ncbi:aldo/keto reductase [Stereum hirsutum FP-91666 SS1]|uniref:aldo/keto reductase n=1 Tax=Stereum hirsutum (strain FP-91666) TaxID=721885 RepID=UPI000440F0BD|nr:aldo/keto reductase [Stereum hirsutum FP-91666 SS1]EIM92841.1 aldo/keto reductase [Stereum hirsutum FP-91666 SS1]
MIQQTTKLSGTAANIVLAKTGHGLAGMTQKPDPLDDITCFKAIKASLDSVPAGAKMLLNSAEFYGRSPPTSNLELLSRFFEKYPEYAEKAFLSVKGATKADSMMTDNSPENLKRSVDTCIAALRGMKKIDLFECARVDPKYRIEDTLQVLSGFVKERKFDHIGLSECSAETVRRANKVWPIASVEIEISPFSYEDETKKVVETCKELGIAVVGYSPIGRGLLTGTINKADDLPEGDYRKHFSRFQEGNVEHNAAIVDALTSIAKKKNVSTTQLSIAWVSALGSHVIPLPGSSNATRTLENLAGGDIELSTEELDEISQVLAAHTVKGSRYFDKGPVQILNLWG